MQTANIVLHLGGDSGTTVPKYAITVSEIAVLQAIHGAGAISEVEPTEDVERSSREEIKRLAEIYGRAMIQDDTGTKVSVMNLLFPGAAAQAFQSLDQLELDESFFKATERAKAVPAPKRGKKVVEAVDEPIDEPIDEPSIVEQDDVAIDDEPIDEPVVEAPVEDGKLFG